MTAADKRTRTVLCGLDELGDPGSLGMTLQHGDALLDVFVVRHGNAVRAYLNRCPHTGSPLDWIAHEFLSPDRQYIQCATHAALFRPVDGVCIAGPCSGERLAAIPVQLQDGLIVVPGTLPPALTV